MWKYFTAHETRRWIDTYDRLVEGYNNTFHRSVKMTPIKASKPENSPLVWYNFYEAYLAVKYGQPKFKVSETVRILKYETVFDKGYFPNYSKEFFKIKQVKIGRPIVYELKDTKKEELTGIYYEDELSPYDVTEKTTYKVEKVLLKKLLKVKNLYWLSIRAGLISLMNKFLPKI